MDLLPNLNELIPILDVNSPFYECGFNMSFADLSFQQKLQVLCDVIRQTIYPNGFPNPDNDILEMNGNCYTASKCFLNYAKKLNVGVNHRCALVRKRSFDLEDVTSIHVVALIDSEDGHTYQVDSTPFVGYKYGSVDDVTYSKLYEECVVIDDKIDKFLYRFRKIIYEDFSNNLDISKIDEIIELCSMVDTMPILKGYAALVLKIIYKHSSVPDEKEKIRVMLDKIKPCTRNNAVKLREVEEKLKIATTEWEEELNDLKSSDSSPKRQQELAINIVQENKWLNSALERYIYINGTKIRLSSINPRFFLANRYQTLIIPQIKSFDSCCFLRDVLHDSENSSIVWNYFLDLALQTEQTQLNPTLFSGVNFAKSELERLNILLSREDSGISSKARNGNVLVSSNYSEDALNFLIGYPEHQSMNKFMYPNPILVKKK